LHLHQPLESFQTGELIPFWFLCSYDASFHL
jgi:hypothetical protein